MMHGHASAAARGPSRQQAALLCSCTTAVLLRGSTCLILRCAAHNTICTGCLCHRASRTCWCKRQQDFSEDAAVPPACTSATCHSIASCRRSVCMLKPQGKTSCWIQQTNPCSSCHSSCAHSLRATGSGPQRLGLEASEAVMT